MSWKWRPEYFKLIKIAFKCWEVSQNKPADILGPDDDVLLFDGF